MKGIDRMALTTRDIHVINFLEDTRLLMNTQQISRYFYSSPSRNKGSALVVARRRLSVMTKGRYLKRVRESNNKEYIYYLNNKTPKKYEHKLLMSELLVTMNEQGFNILKVDVEYRELQQDYGLRPDMRVEFEYYSLNFVAFVEVDRTKTFTNEAKYKRLIEGRKVDVKVQSALSDRFMLISVCDKKPVMKGVQWIKTDMSNFIKFKYDFDRMISTMR